MEKTPFDIFTNEYEDWFRENEIVFQSELLAIKLAVPDNKIGIEIGVGSGLFAEKLKINYGIDPSERMLELARQRNIIVKKGVAEDLPYENNSFDFALFVTSICFVDNPAKAINEAYRILKKNGGIIITIIDKDSSLGHILERDKNESKFYSNARFFSVEEIIELLEVGGFMLTEIFQTLINEKAKTVEQPGIGYGEGSFVVIKGKKIGG